MLTQPSNEALIALQGFVSQPRWSDVDKMIEAEIAEATRRLLGASELRTIGEAQGRVKALRELQDLARSVRELMEKKGLRPSF